MTENGYVIRTQAESRAFAKRWAIRLASAVSLLLFLLLGVGHAWAQTRGLQTAAPPSDQPLYLRLETGVHEATINGITRLPGTDTVVTVSDDKSARLWGTDTLEARGIIRPPIGPRDEGDAYAVAASPKMLAIGGRIRDPSGGYAIALYDVSSRRPIGLIKGLPQPALSLQFSNSGGTLAVGMMGGAGVRQFDMNSFTMLPADTAFRGDVVSMDFADDDRLVVASEEDGIRIYGPDHKPLNNEQPRGITPFGVAFSSDGRLLAVGDRLRATVHLFAVGPGGKLQLVRDLQGATSRAGNLAVVAFSADGKTLFAAGSYKDTTGQRMLRRWSLDGRNALDIPVATDTVTSLLAIDDSVLFTSAEPSLGRVDGNKLARKTRSGHVDLRNAGLGSFRVSNDGSVIEMPIGQQQLGGAQTNQATIVFDVQAHGFIAPNAAPRLHLPFAAAKGLGVTEWQNSRATRVNGRLLDLEPRETVHSVAVAPDGHGAAVGTDFYVRFEGAAGEAWKAVTEAPAWVVNVSGDSRLVVAGLGDGTVHWYNAVTGEELLALYIDPVVPRFVLWTPDGFFDHDHPHDGRPDGRNLIGYQFNVPNGRNSEFIEIGQLYPRFFRPDLVGLAFRDDTVAHNILLDQRKRTGTVNDALASGLPSQVSLVDACGRDASSKASGCPDTRPFDTRKPADKPEVALETSADTLLIEYQLSNPNGTLGTVNVRHNEAVIRPEIFVDEEDAHSRKEEVAIPLGDGRNVIRLTPISASGAVEGSAPAASEITVYRRAQTEVARDTQQPGSTTTPAPVPTRPHTVLYLLSVGVSHFARPQLDLKNADNDARALADLMRGSDAPVYDQAVVTTLLNDQATTDNILAALQEIANKATAGDLVVIFLAGHGQAVDGKYYFAPAHLGMGSADLFQRAVAAASADERESERAVEELFRREGLDQDKLLAMMQSIKALRVALILDTCYSASIATQDAVLQRDLNSTVTNRIGQAAGRFVLSSAVTLAFDSAGASARDTPQGADGHGLFTAFLLQALNGAADYRHRGVVSVDDLANYTQDQVKQATATMREVQQPEFYFGGNQFFTVRAIPTEKP